MSLSTILLLGTTSAMPSLLRVQSTSVQQPHLKVPAVLSIQVPGKRNARSSLSSFSSKGRSACQRLLSEDFWRRFCTDCLDVYAMMNGKILDLRSTLWSAGIVGGCTVHIHYRLRGGRNRHRLRETCRPRLVNHKSCLLEVRLVWESSYA